MTAALLSAVPALVVIGCLAVFLVGLRGLRADPVDGLEVEDLLLLREAKRDDVTGRGPLARLAEPLVPLILRVMGPTLEARLRRMIELAGRPEGIDVRNVVHRMAMWLLIMAPLAVMAVLQGQPGWFPCVPWWWSCSRSRASPA